MPTESEFHKSELLEKVRNLPFNRLRVNGHRLNLFSFSVRGELVEPQRNTFAEGSVIIIKPDQAQTKKSQGLPPASKPTPCTAF